jgi:hypothetical protein
MRFRPSLLLVLAAVVTLPTALSGDALIIAGGGWVGRWETEIVVANVSADPIDVLVSIGGLPLGMPCPPNCTAKFARIPGRGTKRFLASEFIGTIYVGPQMIRVEVPNCCGGPDGPLPVVHARAFSKTDASQFAELPVVRESSIRSMHAEALVFPGASRGPGVYSNLILESIDDAAEVLVEAFDGDGSPIQSLRYWIPGRLAQHASVQVDILGNLGVSILEGGQIRATRLAGTGTLWGVLTTVIGTGSLKATPGANP